MYQTNIAEPFDVERHLRRMVDALAYGLAVERDPASAGASIERRVAIRPVDEASWLEVGMGKPAVVHRKAPKDLEEVTVPVNSLASSAMSDDRLDATSRMSAVNRATTMISDAFPPDEMPRRNAIRAIAPWMPILEKGCYGLATGLAARLDGERGFLLRSLAGGDRRSAVRVYAERLNLIARLTLMATPSGARGWLSEMASAFEWITWTPSWPLLRERGMWLAAVAARTAAAFGPNVLEKYARSLGEAREPMRVFDALYGMTSIAFDEPSERIVIAKLIRRELDRRSSIPTGGDWLQIAADQASKMIEGPDEAQEESARMLRRVGNGLGFGAPAIFRSDGAQALNIGGHMCFRLLPSALEAASIDFFPRGAKTRRDLGLGEGDMERLTDAAWATGRRQLGVTLH